ncbi:hypothetical protein F5Y15DRAFT_139880 [Xylariaceae sp. FL0016]|nr:hypothetical protein F5Y15DRAFT_139880 [Xylariaceae sp. FL0016]
MNGQGFIQLNGPGGPGGQRPPPPPQGGGRPPQGFPPAPPRELLPTELNQGPFTRTIDVTPRTEADFLEELTEYLLYRFEKLPERNKYDDYGRPVLPTWDKAVRTQECGMSQKDIIKQIRMMNRHHAPVMDKRNSLSPGLQRQLDSTLQELMSREYDLINYQWVLEQIDHQLRPIDPYLVTGMRAPATSRRPHGRSAHHGSTSRSSHQQLAGRRPAQNSRYHRGNKRPMERVSLTAYFKRVPRPEANIYALYDAKKHMYFMQQNPMPMVPGGGRPPGSPPPINGPKSGPGGAGGAPIGKGPAGKGPAKKGSPVMKMKMPPKVMRESESDTDSCSSRGSSSSRSTSTRMTPTSSQSSCASDKHGNRGQTHHKNHGRGRTPSRNRGGQAKYFGVGVHDDRAFDNGPRLPHGVPFTPAMPQTGVEEEIERAREDAYIAGRRDERSDALFVEDIMRDETRRAKPRVVQTRTPPPLFRARTVAIHPEEFHRQRDLGDDFDMPRFTNLSLEDSDYEADFRREDARRRRMYEYRAHNGSILSEDPFQQPRSPSISSYAYSRDGHIPTDHHGRPYGRSVEVPIIEIPHRHTFRSRPLRGRQL